MKYMGTCFIEGERCLLIRGVITLRLSWVMRSSFGYFFFFSDIVPLVSGGKHGDFNEIGCYFYPMKTGNMAIQDNMHTVYYNDPYHETSLAFIAGEVLIPHGLSNAIPLVHKDKNRLSTRSMEQYSGVLL